MTKETMTAPPEAEKMEEAPVPSTSAEQVDGDDVDAEANRLMGTGRRHLVMKDVRSAVNAFQEASSLLGKKYGETADQCADAFYYYGMALLDLARMENNVLGNALEGIPEEEDEECEKEDPNIPSASNLDEKEREQLREQVYDAMAEKEEKSDKENGETKNGEDSKEPKVEESKADEMECEDSSEAKEQEPEVEAVKVEKATEEAETKEEEKVSEAGGEEETEGEEKMATDSAGEEKMATDSAGKEHTTEAAEKSKTEAESAQGHEEKPQDKAEEAKEKSEAMETKLEETKEKPNEKSEVAEAKPDTKDKPEVAENKPEEAKDKPEVAENNSEEAKDKPEVAENNSEEAKDKPEVAEDAKAVTKPEEAAASEEKEDQSEGDEEAEPMEGDEEEGEESEDNEETEEKENEEEEVDNLQLAWEMLDLSKIIFKRQQDKEAQLKAAQAHLKLGEVSIESENYTQAVEDFLACLTIQKKHLEEHDRLLAETHYQLGLAYQYSTKNNEAISHFTQSIDVIEKRLVVLKEQLEKATEESKEETQKEMDELKGLLPDIKEKIEDSKEAQKTSEDTDKALKETLGGTSGFPQENGGTSTSAATEKSKDCSVPVTNCVSDISHLVRKKRKPEEESPLKEAKKSKSEPIENGSGNGDASVPRNEQEKTEEAEKQTPMETATVESTA